MGLIVIALCVGCSWERASNVSEDQIQWGSETRDYLSYEEYFSQQRLYDYAEDVFSGWSLQDADISYDGTVLRLTDSKGIPILFSHPACSVITEEISASVTITTEISLLRFILQTWSMASAMESILLRCPLMRRRYFCYSSKLLTTAFSLMLFRSYGNTLASLSMTSARKTPWASLTPAHRLLCQPS